MGLVHREKGLTMTVYLKGIETILDRIEKNVKSVEITDEEINIRYEEPLKYGIVSGVTYFTNQMKVEKVEG